jgi:hypothetical protein
MYTQRQNETAKFEVLIAMNKKVIADGSLTLLRSFTICLFVFKCSHGTLLLDCICFNFIWVKIMSLI